MLYALFSLDRGVNSSRRLRFEMILATTRDGDIIISNLPAAAAGSWLDVFFASAPRVRDESRGTGLRLRLESVFLLKGERERRSNREDRLTSGSV